MSHHINAIITKKTDLLKNSGIPFNSLPQDFAILLDNDNNRKQLDGQDFAAIWTDYFGGFGEQGCTVFSENKATPTKNIDEGLKILGVVADISKEDEFDAIRLGRFRENEDIYNEREDI